MAAKLFADTEVPSDFNGSYDLKLNVTKGFSPERAELLHVVTGGIPDGQTRSTVTYRWEHPAIKPLMSGISEHLGSRASSYLRSLRR